MTFLPLCNPQIVTDDIQHVGTPYEVGGYVLLRIVNNGDATEEYKLEMHLERNAEMIGTAVKKSYPLDPGEEVSERLDLAPATDTAAKEAFQIYALKVSVEPKSSPDDRKTRRRHKTVQVQAKNNEEL